MIIAVAVGDSFVRGRQDLAVPPPEIKTALRYFVGGPVTL